MIVSALRDYRSADRFRDGAAEAVGIGAGSGTVNTNSSISRAIVVGTTTGVCVWLATHLLSRIFGFPPRKA